LIDFGNSSNIVMTYIYEVMDKVKEKIVTKFKNQDSQYKKGMDNKKKSRLSIEKGEIT